MGDLVLPSALRGRPITVAEARAAGLRSHELRSLALHRPTRGVRTEAVPAGIRERAAAVAAANPSDAAFSHVTAALLWGLPLPAALESQQALDVMRPSGVAQVRRVGCIGHRGLERRSVSRVHGLRAVGLADTWVDLAEVADRGLGVDDLVVVGDAVARRLGSDWAITALAEALAGRSRPRGKALLEVALPLVRFGSRSPMETRARLMFHRAGFPEPELNAAVHDAHGEWLLEGDLYWRSQRVVGEYQGSDHTSRRRRSADSARAGLAEEHDHRVIEIYAEDVYLGGRRRACLRRFARALELDPATLRIE